jgi:ABC-2 type transport system permease protein
MLVAVPVTVASIGLLGFLLSMASVRYRHAWALGNATEYPIWLICGFLVPLSALPGWVRPISWLLAPTWGVEAIRAGTLGGSPWLDLARCVALGVAYAAIGVVLARVLLRSAREHATLALS